MSGTFAVQMKEQAFKGKECILEIGFLTKVKRPCELPRFHESAAIWLFREFKNGLTIAAIKAQLTFSYIYKNRHKATITIYTKVVKHLLRLCYTEAVIERAEGGTPNFKKGSLTP